MSRWSLLAVLVVAGCGADSPTATGEACESDGECASNFCAGICRDPLADDDDDGVDNRTERDRTSDPGRSDTDRDGLLDGVEGDRDTDKDGRLDVVESALVDADLDCLPAQLDVDEATPDDDLEKLAALRCRHAGVCADGEVVARCHQLEVEGETIAEVECDYGSVFDFEDGAETSCDGADNDCDGQTDEDLGMIDSTGAVRGLGESCLGTGACATREGVVECALGRAVCSVDAGGSEAPSTTDDIDCDAIDNDCDGVTDEGVAWLEPLSGELLGFGEPCAGLGACGLGPGVVECDALTHAGQCSTAPGGSGDLSLPESCNGIDDDCDGVTDEELVWRAPDGASKIVGEDCGVGVCRGGEVVCGGAGSAVCSTEGEASAEVCNGEDDDCDGDIDEAADLVSACPSLGVCGELTVLDVQCAGDLLVCLWDRPELVEDHETRCNGLDDDCDGETDDGLVPGGDSACYGVGACAGQTGVVVCSADGLGTQCTANASDGPEVCNGVDDDCDGETDESPSDVPLCAVAGVCADYANAGASCAGGAWRCAYASDLAYEPEESRCDALDNDCDGLTDEGLARTPTGTWRVVPGHSPPDRFSWPAADSPFGAFLFGGAARAADSDAPVLLGDLWRYDAAAVSWERVSVTGGPSARAGHAVTWDPKHQLLVVQGGFTSITGEGALGPDGVAVATMYVFDPVAASWSVVAERGDVPAPARRYHALAAFDDGRVVVHGGLGASDGEPLMMIGTLAKDENGWGCSWEPGPVSADVWRSGHAIAIVDGAVEVVEGELPPALAIGDVLVGGDPLVRVVDGVSVPFTSALTSPPPVLRGAVLAHTPGGVLLIEGSTEEGEAGRRTFTLTLDPPTISGEVAWNAPAPRVGGGLVVAPDGTLRLFGGARRAGRSALQDVWRWDAVAEEWRVEVPAAPPHAPDATRPALWGAPVSWDDDVDGALLWGDGALWSYRNGAFTKRTSDYAPPDGDARFAGPGRLVVAGDELSAWSFVLDGGSVTWSELAHATYEGTLVAAGPRDGGIGAVLVADGQGYLRVLDDTWSEPIALGKLEAGPAAWDARHERAFVLGRHTIYTVDGDAITATALSGSGAPLYPALVWDANASALFGMGGVHTSTLSPETGPATARTFLFDLDCE